MKIKNNNTYNIMYGMEFLKASEIKDINENIAKDLLKHPNVEEYVTKADVKEITEENEKLKKELELAKLKEEATDLGIEFAKNIGIAKLQTKIDKVKNKE